MQETSVAFVSQTYMQAFLIYSTTAEKLRKIEPQRSSMRSSAVTTPTVGFSLPFNTTAANTLWCTL